MDCADRLRDCVGSEYEHGLDVAIYDMIRNCAFILASGRIVQIMVQRIKFEKNVATLGE
jgi:hypothetical protein